MEPEPIYIASECLSFMIYKDGDSNSTYPLELVWGLNEFPSIALKTM